jgi:hypothetical protein
MFHPPPTPTFIFDILKDSISSINPPITLLPGIIANTDEQQLNNTSDLTFTFESVAKACLESPNDALLIAQRGLSSLSSKLHYRRMSKECELQDVIEMMYDPTTTQLQFETQIFKGTGISTTTTTTNIFQSLTSGIKQQAIQLVIQKLAEPEIIPVCEKLERNPEWLDLHGTQFIALGALNDTCPIRDILLCGGTVYAIDSPNKQHEWNELIQQATSWSGDLIVPVKRNNSSSSSNSSGQIIIGADLIQDLPEIAHWLVTQCAGRPSICGNYVYTPHHGEFLHYCAAADAIIEYLCRQLPDTQLHFTCSPLETFIVSDDAMLEARNRYLSSSENTPLQQLLNKLSGGKWFAPNQSDIINERSINTTGRGVHGGAVKARRFGRDQDKVYSFNFCSAICSKHLGIDFQMGKLIQRWRANVARQIGTYKWLADKTTHRVSANISLADPFAKSLQLKFGLGSIPNAQRWDFLLFIRDLRDVESAANPTMRLVNPIQLFSQTAIHGGIFRHPYRIDSLVTVSRIISIIQQFVGGGGGDSKKNSIIIVGMIMAIMVAGLSNGIKVTY